MHQIINYPHILNYDVLQLRKPLFVFQNEFTLPWTPLTEDFSGGSRVWSRIPHASQEGGAYARGYARVRARDYARAYATSMDSVSTSCNPDLT